MCRYPSSSLRPDAKAVAVFTTFLICLPLIFFSPSWRSSSWERPPFWTLSPWTLRRNATQILRLESELRSWYRRETWIRDWKASSNTRTLFVVKKRMPRKYLRSTRSEEYRNRREELLTLGVLRTRLPLHYAQYGAGHVPRGTRPLRR